MKIIIAGSRDLDVDVFFIDACFNRMLKDLDVNPPLCNVEIVSGTAIGMDLAGERFSEWKGVACTRFPAEWHKLGKAAGPIRNNQMANYADGLILIWDGESKGSANMKTIMQKLGKPVFEVIIKYKGLV